MAFVGCEVMMGKYMRGSQLLTIIKMHLYLSLAATFLGLIAVPVVTGNTTKYIFSGVFVFIYMLVLYSKSEDIARRDKRSYTDEVSYWWKGLLLPAGIFICWIFLYILYHVSWKYNIITNTSGFINNMLFVIWSFVFTGFMNLSDGKINYIGIIVAAAAPLIACGGGYLAGYKGFDLSIKVSKIMYEEKEDKEKPRKDD